MKIYNMRLFSLLFRKTVSHFPNVFIIYVNNRRLVKDLITDPLMIVTVSVLPPPLPVKIFRNFLRDNKSRSNVGFANNES